MKIGYSRVSTHDQTRHLQFDALKAAGCQEIFEDTARGAADHKPGLEKALALSRSGDSLVVWKLDRLGRTVKGLIAFMEELKARRIEFESLTDKIDTSTPIGQFVFHMI